MNSVLAASDRRLALYVGALACLALGGLVFGSVVSAARRRIRVRIRPSGPHVAAWSVLIALASSTAALATGPRSFRSHTRSAPPPWSDTGGFPPPRPPVQATDARRESHAVSDPPRDARAERMASMARHPAGRRLAQGPRVYRVEPGDSLWAIAEKVLQTNDRARVARYWPRIHRANRPIIGPDPNFIYPGQVLHLPQEHET